MLQAYRTKFNWVGWAGASLLILSCVISAGVWNSWTEAMLKAARYQRVGMSAGDYDPSMYYNMLVVLGLVSIVAILMVSVGRDYVPVYVGEDEHGQEGREPLDDDQTSSAEESEEDR